MSAASATNVFWKKVLDECDLLNERSEGSHAWATVVTGLSSPTDYPLDHNVVKALVDAFKSLSGKTNIAINALFPMITLSRTDIGKEYDIIDVPFIEFFCDVYFSSAHGPPHLNAFNAKQVCEFLVSEKFIFEEIRGLPGFTKYFDYVSSIFHNEMYAMNFRTWVGQIRFFLEYVPQSGRLTKRADSDS